MAVSPGLDVIIVSYRSSSLLRECLRSLRTHAPRVPMTITVVDNASSDATVAIVRREFPYVTVIESSVNLGFARANNLAIEQSDGEYVLALNPDTRVTAGALDYMLHVMATHREVGIAGCRLELEDGTFDHAARRSFPTLLGAAGHFTGFGRRDDAPSRFAQYRAPDVESGPTDAVSGAFMLMRRAALEEVGCFDESYWMYMEDLDLCYRFARAGWTTWYDPGATVIHLKGGTTGRVRDLRLNHAFHVGMYRFYRKHCAPERNPFVNGVVYGAIATKFAGSVARSAVLRAGAFPAEAPQPLVLHPTRAQAGAPIDEMSPAA